MANWFEERVHREEKGNGRAMTRTHFPKKHDELIGSDTFCNRSGEDDTKYRIIGDGNYPKGTTENYQYPIKQYSYGKSTNKADTFPKVGRKQQLTEEMVGGLLFSF